MKYFTLGFLLFSLSACVDVTQYVSFDKKGNLYTKLRFDFSQTLVSSIDNNHQYFFEKGEESDKFLDMAVKKSIVSNEFFYGVEIEASGKFSDQPEDIPFLPIKDKNGFSIAWEQEGDNLGTMLQKKYKKRSAETEAMLSSAKYRIIISKTGLGKPLAKASALCAETSYTLELQDFQNIYIVDMPLSLALTKGLKRVEFSY